MADTLALINLYDLVTAAYVAESDDTPHFFGWEEPPRQRASRARILWVPGAPEGEVGEIKPPRLIDEYPARALANLHEKFHVYIHGYEPTADQKDEKAHYQACRFAFDTWFRHVYNSVFGTFELGPIKWNPGTRPKEFRYGATIQAVGTIQAVIPDAQVDQLIVTDGTMSLQMLDETESVVIDNGAAP